MRSLTTALGQAIRPANKTPVPYASRRLNLLGFAARNDAEAQMRAMGSVGTLFAIVNRTSTAAAQVDWRLWRKAPSGKDEDRTEVTRHAALAIWDKPNRFYSRQSFVETFSQHIDLVGEFWWLIGRDPRSPLPLELWPVRPDRMEPVPDPDEFIAGYIYTSPEGERIRLGVDEVITRRLPNPLDPYRGMGPVQSILTDLDSSRYTAQWNRNFFINSAIPGGYVEVDHRLSDEEFEEMRDRLDEQHKGVANAHRVALIEQGAKYVEAKYTMRDMQFSELRSVSREIIREAFGMSKTMLGQTEDVNRATAEAAEYVFANWLLKSRLERIKGALNEALLPLFVAKGRDVDVEYDYDDPTPANAEANNAERDSRVNGAVALAGAGWDPAESLEAMGLPEITFTGAPVPSPSAPQPLPGITPAAAALPPAGGHRHARHPRRPRNAGDPPDLDPDDLPDISHVQESWEQALDDLLDGWAGVEADQKAALVDAVRKIAETGSLTDLTDLAVDSEAAAALLTAAMVALAAEAADQVADEAAEQGVTVEPQEADGSTIADVAVVVAALRAAQLAAGAAGAAMRANGPDASADDIAEAVREHLDSLSPDGPRPVLGGALTGAQNEGRFATLRSAPEGALYGDEVNDTNTCSPCLEVSGRWLGNISEMDRVSESYPGGAYGGYIGCLGRERCRGTIVGVWRD